MINSTSMSSFFNAFNPTLSFGVQDHGRLRELNGFGSNPGALQARTYLPPLLEQGAPLVVVLHGCTQTANGYDLGAGWSALADELGFALLFPEQSAANNPNGCFNWFSPIDARRGSGEALSIRQMIAAMVAAHGIDEERIHINGLSAGGAMASIMLATYPEVFASGAIIAGLPFGAATSVQEALERMRGEGYPPDAVLAERLRGSTGHGGPWPRISVWQGGEDQTVAPANAEKIIGQWQAVHSLSAVAPEHSRVGSAHRRIWRDSKGCAMIEAYDVPGIGHGTPLHTTGPQGCGMAGPFMLEAGINSTRHLARLWGLEQSVEAALFAR